jgi:hypothetical protein
MATSFSDRRNIGATINRREDDGINASHAPRFFCAEILARIFNHSMQLLSRD